MNAPSYPVAGHCDPAFAAVAEAFRRNGEPTDDDPGDLGAMLAVIVDGTTVVDLRGGWADLGRSVPWGPDTLVNAYSTAKPLVAALVLGLVADGVLTLDDPLRGVWPDLGDHHLDLTLRDVLAHRAALPGIGPPLSDEVIGDWHALVAALARTPPWWPPGTGHGYHVNTFGFLAGHPAVVVGGRPFGRLLRDRLTAPAGLDVHVGLGPAELARCATVDAPASGRPPEEIWSGNDQHARMLRACYANPRGISGVGIVNTGRWRRAEVPSTNAHATALGLAGFYAGLLGQRGEPILPSDLLVEMTRPASDGPDLVLGRETTFGLGVTLHRDDRPIGLTSRAYGHYGYGGSLGFADPEAGVGFAYLMSRPGDRWRNPRTVRLLEALADCL